MQVGNSRRQRDHHRRHAIPPRPQKAGPLRPAPNDDQQEHLEVHGASCDQMHQSHDNPAWQAAEAGLVPWQRPQRPAAEAGNVDAAQQVALEGLEAADCQKWHEESCRQAEQHQTLLLDTVPKRWAQQTMR